MSKNQERIERLLARGRLGGPGRERILERALRTAGVEGGRSQGWTWRWRWPIRLAPVAIGVAAAVVFLRPADRDGFRAKGGGANAPQVEALCTAPAAGACSQKGKLAIRVQAVPADAFLIGYVTPAGTDVPEERRWFSPASEGEATPRVEAGASPHILPQGVPLDAFAPGRYDVHLRLVVRPATRADALDAPGVAQSITPLTVAP